MVAQLSRKHHGVRDAAVVSRFQCLLLTASDGLFVRVLLLDEVGGDSCLILLLLCLVTVVISVGGTALYCTLVGTYSNICTDFAQNVDFYVTSVRGFFEGLGNLLPLWT